MYNRHLDPLQDELEREHPRVTLKGRDYLDMDLFNRTVSSSEPIFSAECWSGVHPLLATIPLDCGYTMPYGLIYAKDPPQEVLQFIMAVGQMGSE